MRKANLRKKEWWEGYVKDSAPFLEVLMEDVPAVPHLWRQLEIALSLPQDKQFNLALELFRDEFIEDKQTETIFLKEILIPGDVVSCPGNLLKFESLFDEGLI